MAIALDQITGLILAGGQGSRMGGVDKGLQQLHGQAMVAHIITRLAPQVRTLAINANRGGYAAFGPPVWPDLLSGFAGPLAGLQSGLSHCRTDYLAAVPCDAPLLAADLVQLLAAALEQQQADAAFAVTGTAAQRQQHPVFCLLKKKLLPALNAYLQGGDRKIGHWLASVNSVAVPFADAIAFSNINTRQELQQLEHAQIVAKPKAE